MDFRRFLKLALAVFVTAGLVSAPLVTPAAAKGPSMVEMTDMSAMSADMPCCPDGQKSKDCQDCPLVAICVLKTAQAGPSLASALLVRHAIRTAHSVLNDAPAAGLDHPPPDQPPRILV
jgi:hypothetical protein